MMSKNPTGHPTVVVVSPRSGDHATLEAIFRRSPWKVDGAFTADGGVKLLRRNQPHNVVICAEDLPDGNWKSLLADLDELPGQPKMIVWSRLADERLWAEVLNLGAFDLLRAEPFEAEEVLRVTESACRAAHRTQWNFAQHRVAASTGFSPLLP